MAKNDVELKGNLTRDPHFDYLDGRDGPVPFMRFTLAVDRHPPRQQGTDYLQVVSYGQSALHDHAYLRQGSEVFVEGWVRTRNGTDTGGNPATRIEVVAEEITFLRNIEWEKGQAAKMQHVEEGQVQERESPLSVPALALAAA
ncbi:MAG: single-stranded DNA-binding protein [Planctomycetota bacterium]|jgi:single-strand DNA-binding protein